MFELILVDLSDGSEEHVTTEHFSSVFYLGKRNVEPVLRTQAYYPQPSVDRLTYVFSHRRSDGKLLYYRVD